MPLSPPPSHLGSSCRSQLAPCVALALSLACASNGSDGATGTGIGGAGAGAGVGGSVGGAGTSSVGGTATGGVAGTAGNAGSAGSAGSVSTGGSAGAEGMGGAGTGGAAGSGGGGGSGGGVDAPWRDRLPTFILGADISITLEDETWDATYTDQGVEKPIEEILADHGFNFLRHRTFVNPGAPGGYAADKEETFGDIAHVITLAQRGKAVGMGSLLDLHYSDTWADPSHQTPPAAWQGQSAEELETSVYNFTFDAVGQMQSAGVTPEMVQVGNEITAGMLWDVGRNDDDFVNLARLLKAGISAVRDVDPTIVIVLHIEKCNNLQTSRWWVDGVLEEGVEFDVLAQSCYAPDGDRHPGYHGTPEEWATTLNTLADDYPELGFIIAEYSAEAAAANLIIYDLPDRRGVGTFNWDPTRFYDTHPNQPLFDTGSAWNDYIVNERMSLYDTLAADFGL